MVMKSRLFFQKLLENKIQNISNENFSVEACSYSECVTDLCSGSVAGAVQIIISQPFDTIKVKQQAFPKMYKNMFDCFVKTYRNDGLLRGIYAGSFPALLANVGENAVIFLAYERCRKSVATLLGIETADNLPIAGESLAGGLGACFSSFVVCPIELVKCRMQAMNELRLSAIAKNRPPPDILSMSQLVRSIYCNDGVPGFFRGFAATFARDLPGYFCFFGCYEALKEAMKQPEQKRTDVGPLITILASGIAGIALCVASFPADVIKSRAQIKNLKCSMLSVGRYIIKKDGVGALYRGLMPTILQTMPAAATLFLVYEYVKRRLNYMFINKGEH